MEKRFFPDPTLDRLREAADYAEKVSTPNVSVDVVCRPHVVTIRATAATTPRRVVTENFWWEDIRQPDDNPILAKIDRVVAAATKLLPYAKHVKPTIPATAATLFK